MPLLALLLTFLLAVPAAAQVLPGIDVLERGGFEGLQDKRVGLVAHPASRARDLRHTVDVLLEGGVDVVALYGPEHGVFGDEYAGDKVEDQKDNRTGLPLLSLYGQTRKPTPEMLAGVDAIVYDLQDIGSRSYTYISTLTLLVDACAENDLPLFVLDRPNPLGGERVEGGGVSQGYESFVSQLDIPYLHGLTVGELAKLIADRRQPEYDKLKIVEMDGWERGMVWEDTGLKWVPTSPHVPTASACWGYAATGIVGELGVVNIGVGYTLPFELVGHPDADPYALAEHLQKHCGGEDVTFLPTFYKPFYSHLAGERLAGVQLVVDPRTAPTLYEINFRAMEFLGAADLLAESPTRHAMFDKVTGGDTMRKALTNDNLDAALADQRAYAEAFKKEREPYLLYE